MRYIIPHYFDVFHCTAAECEDTCCAGWKIMIDEQSLERYRNTGGNFGEQLKASIDWEDGSFKQDACKRCAFLNEDNLCDMQMIGGEKVLCDTCKNYPRHMEEYEGLREGSLSLSCIEAAKIILGCMEPVMFYELEDDAEDEEFEDYDYLLSTKLMDARDCMFEILQNREIDIFNRIAFVYNIAEQIQDSIDKEELYHIDELLEQARSEDAFMKFQQIMDKDTSEDFDYYSTLRKFFRIFSKLEVLKDDWPEYVKKAEWSLFGAGQSEFDENRRKCKKEMTEDYENLSRYMEHTMVYFVYVYFCGAVYDGDALGKMKIAVVSTLLIQELLLAVWITKGDITFEDVVDVSHRFSREVEHSDVNLIRMEKLLKNEVTYPVKRMILP